MSVVSWTSDLCHEKSFCLFPTLNPYCSFMFSFWKWTLLRFIYSPRVYQLSIHKPQGSQITLNGWSGRAETFNLEEYALAGKINQFCDRRFLSIFLVKLTYINIFLLIFSPRAFQAWKVFPTVLIFSCWFFSVIFLPPVHSMVLNGKHAINCCWINKCQTLCESKRDHDVDPTLKRLTAQ